MAHATVGIIFQEQGRLTLDINEPNRTTPRRTKTKHGNCSSTKEPLPLALVASVEGVKFYLHRSY